MKMNELIVKAILSGLMVATIGAHAADAVTNVESTKQSAKEKLVANQPAATPAQSTDAKADKPVTINFSDYVKDGAGCGVPNLDTSEK